MNCNKCNMPYSEDEICFQCDGCPDCCTCYSEEEFGDESFEEIKDDNQE